LGTCSSCGKEIPEGVQYCPECESGAKKEIPAQHTSKMAIASLVFAFISILSIVIVFVCYSRLTKISGLSLFFTYCISTFLAIIFGVADNKKGIQCRGIAVLGLTLGIVGLLFWVIFFLMVFAWIRSYSP
jgi:predicted permease